MFKLVGKYYLDMDEKQYIIKELVGKRKDPKTEELVDNYQALYFFNDLKSFKIFQGYLKKARKLYMVDSITKEEMQSIDDLMEVIKKSDSQATRHVKEINKAIVTNEYLMLEAKRVKDAAEYEVIIKQLKNKGKGEKDA